MRKQNDSIGFVRILLAGGLLVFCIWFIFSNSLLDAYASGIRSQKVAAFVVKALGRIISPGSDLLRFVEANIRKIAHAVEFFLLGTVASVMLVIIRQTGWHMRLHAVLLVLFVAVADESIQMFTGRGAQVSDILLDSFAGFAGIALVFLLHWLFARIGAAFRA